MGARRLEPRAPSRRARLLREADLRPLRPARAELQVLDHRLPGDRSVRHGAGPRADRRQHLPRRAVGGSAVPNAACAGLLRLPDAAARAVPRVERDARRRRRERHPRLAGLQDGEEGPRPGEEVGVTQPDAALPAVRRMLEPRSIAVVGASVKGGSLGESMMAELERGGFEGAIYPVNPGYDEVAGLRCWVWSVWGGSECAGWDVPVVS